MSAVYQGIAGRRVLVTGAAGGIGVAIVRALVAHDAWVVALDRDAARLAALPGAHTGDGPGRVDTFEVDVRSAAAVDDVVETIERSLGPIDLTVIAAGIFRMAAVGETSDDTWEELFAVNSRGVFNTARAVSRRMMPRRRGSIVTVSSNAAGIPRQQMAGYAASKAAASMFTRCLGLELAGFGIRCNVVAPGSTRTPMQTAMWQQGSSEATVIEGSLAAYRPGIPLGKIAEPEDVAAAVLFLLSDAAAHVTMTELYVDGGASLQG